MATNSKSGSIEMRPVGNLKPFARNPRAHPASQVTQLARSINEFGFTIPILIDEAGTIIAGHGRVLAAKEMGLLEVPVIVARGWSEAKKSAYRIADNKLTENSSWDDPMLRVELDNLVQDGFDISLVALSKADMKRLDGGEGEPLLVQSIESSLVADEFWISVRGPLKHQAAMLMRLREASKDLEGVAVDLGTIALDAPDNGS